MTDNFFFLGCHSEADTAEAQFIADSNEVIGLQANDDITTQAPLSTVEPIGERVYSNAKNKHKISKMSHCYVINQIYAHHVNVIIDGCC